MVCTDGISCGGALCGIKRQSKKKNAFALFAKKVLPYPAENSSYAGKRDLSTKDFRVGLSHMTRSNASRKEKKQTYFVNL